MKGKKTIFTSEQERWMREHYAITMNRECANHLGTSMRTMIRYARELGLEKDPDFVRELWRDNCKLMADANRGEGNRGKINLLKYGVPFRFKPGTTNVQRLGVEGGRKRLAKAHARRNETIRKERLRINWGLPQRTKMRLVKNRKATQTRYSLKRMGYVVPGRGSKTVYYTGNTRRSSRTETLAAYRGITIQPMNIEL